jgi:hypothetical protein
MRYLLFISVTLISLNSFSQNEIFEYTENGLNDYVVTEVENKTKEEIYKKAMNWVKETYKHPDKVLVMDIENEKLRISAIASALLFVKKFNFPLDYVIEISIKEGRYKFDLISLTTTEIGTDYKNLPNFKTDKKMVKNFGDSPQRIENYFNGLNESLKTYILGKKKKDDW